MSLEFEFLYFKLQSKMNLKKGANKISFAVTSGLQGRKVLNATIYLWDPDTKIVVSDIDGTITKYFL
jgi:phosphatidate phosphatase LPIN